MVNIRPWLLLRRQRRISERENEEKKGSAEEDLTCKHENTAAGRPPVCRAVASGRLEPEI